MTINRKLEGKPYIVLLLVYWICLFVVILQDRLLIVRTASLVTICLLALSLCPSWVLLVTVPALWLLESRR